MLINNNYGSCNKRKSKRKQPAEYRLTTGDKDIIAGDKNAPVSVYFFYDFACPYCVKQNEVMNSLLDDDELKGKFNIVYKNHPLRSHPKAEKAAKAAFCLRPYADSLMINEQFFDNGRKLGDNLIALLLEKYNADQEEFDQCMNSAEPEKYIKSIQKQGAVNGLTGTPTIYVNNNKVKKRGKDDLKDMIIKEYNRVTKK